jgi:hypothetical protein
MRMTAMNIIPPVAFTLLFFFAPIIRASDKRSTGNSWPDLTWRDPCPLFHAASRLLLALVPDCCTNIDEVFV